MVLLKTSFNSKIYQPPTRSVLSFLQVLCSQGTHDLIGHQSKVALATSLTSILMMAWSRPADAPAAGRLHASAVCQQTALINRTAEELDDKLAMLLDIIAQSAAATARTGRRRALRAYYRDRAVLALFDDMLMLDPKAASLPTCRTGGPGRHRCFRPRLLSKP
jgi:hypothetical protein